MKWKVYLLIIGFVMSSSLVYAESENDIYNFVIAGKTCKESLAQAIECDYKIGKDLHIQIAGIGDPDTGVAFLKSDSNGDYYASFGLNHGCIIVKRGMQSHFDRVSYYAFISPKNGKVYRDWIECKSGF